MSATVASFAGHSVKALSTRNVVQRVERALAENSALRKGIILQQLPRNDFFHLANLFVENMNCIIYLSF